MRERDNLFFVQPKRLLPPSPPERLSSIVPDHHPARRSSAATAAQRRDASSAGSKNISIRKRRSLRACERILSPRHHQVGSTAIVPVEQVVQPGNADDGVV